jgi:hypothetical protein
MVGTFPEEFPCGHRGKGKLETNINPKLKPFSVFSVVKV